LTLFLVFDEFGYVQNFGEEVPLLEYVVFLSDGFKNPLSTWFIKVDVEYLFSQTRFNESTFEKYNGHVLDCTQSVQNIFEEHIDFG